MKNSGSKKPVIIDIECDSLTPSVIWVAVTKDLENNSVRVWTTDILDLADFLSGRRIVGHNIIGFDLPVLRNLAGVRNTLSDCIDTLVVSRLRNSWDYREHSLEDWGERLGFPKTKFNDFSKLSQEMIDYCIQDVEVTHKLYEYFQKYLENPKWHKSLALEHFSAQDCRELHETGFMFDYDKASGLYHELAERLAILNKEMQEAIPPAVHLEEFIPKRDNKTKGYIKGVPFIKETLVPFNPGSHKQRIERLWEYGWKPKDKTKSHLKNKDPKKKKHFEYYGWKTNEENLATLPEDAPEAARKLAEWLILSSRYSTLTEWFNAYNTKTGRIHGNFNHIHPWTHRKSHSGPNMGNIPSIPSIPEGKKPTKIEQLNLDYNPRMRALWRVPENRRLVGVDADGIQLRILAHYVNNPAYTEAIVNGKKEDGTDIHNVNRRALQLPHLTRDHAKTFIYAWLLGAGVGKVAEILQCEPSTGRVAMENFLESIDGLSALKYGRIPEDAERGYFIGLDDRFVKCDSEHLMLAGYLQNGESVIMKWADRIWKRKLKKEKIPFWKVNDVHDEWQTETLPEVAEYVMQVQIDSIRQAGEELELKCPLAGSGKIGLNWRETH